MSRENRIVSGRSPFLAQFAKPVAPHAGAPFRYDAKRQIGQVRIEGVWIDAIDAIDVPEISQTLETKVQRETTDDR